MDSNVTGRSGDLLWDAPGQAKAEALRRTYFTKRDRRADAVRKGGQISLVRGGVAGALVAADAAAIALSIGIAELAAWAINRWIMHQSYVALTSSGLQSRALIWLALSVGVLCWFGLRGTYTQRNALQQDIKQSTSAFLTVLLIDGFVEYAGKSNFSRLWIVLVWLMAAVLVPIARVEIRRILAAFGLWKVGAVVIGQGEHSTPVEDLLTLDGYVGYAGAYRSTSPIDTGRPLSEIAVEISEDMRRHGAEIAILAPDESEMTAIGRIVDALNSNLIPYVLVPPIQRVPFSGLTVQTIVQSDAVLLTPRLGLMSPLRRKAKRVFDVMVSATLLLLMLPLFIVVGAIIAIDGGSPFYGHQRIGRAGRPFKCLKFRSMAKNSEEILARVLAEDPEAARQWQQNFKLDNDPRITKIGNFLRKTSLDELPQLINVLRGEMSLVGPRPVVAKELDMFYGEDAFYYRLVRPGITGLWQVSGRSNTTYDRRVFLDAWYVRNWDHWTDLAILFNTIPSVLRRDGAR